MRSHNKIGNTEIKIYLTTLTINNNIYLCYYRNVTKDKTNSPDELLDLVDENDNVIGEVWKSEANRDPKLIHREVAILIFDDRNQVLLQQRSLKKAHQPGFWTIAAAGHVTKGMSPKETAHKELKEELGFDVDLKFAEKFRYDLPTESRFMSLFLGKYSGQKIKIDPVEVSQVKWFTRDEFEDLIRSDALKGKKLESFVRRFWAGELGH